MTTSRDQILKVLLPLFPESEDAGVYYSPELNAYMLVAGDEITIKAEGKNDS
jgi:hypothetical protein